MTATSPSPNPFAEWIDLANARLGGAVLFANDDFFAEKENLVKADEPVYFADRYTERGKWMDGWESRRRRDPGNDWCVIRLAYPGRVRGLVVDTSHFLGNFPPECAVSGLLMDESQTIDWANSESLQWDPLLTKSPLLGGERNLFQLAETARVSHLRLDIYPDGGIARLRALGEVEVPALAPNTDLAALDHGGRVVGVSDDFFGNRHNLLLPGPSRGMFDGWETRRLRGPGNDWTVIRLGCPGRLDFAEIDTRWFRGNAPGACSLEGTTHPDWTQSEDWEPLLAHTPLQPDQNQRFRLLHSDRPWTHVRLQIYPDGGIARLRLYGHPL